MRNLGDSARNEAERAARNGHILAELVAVDVPVSLDARSNACGVLGPFKFHRAWRYWTVSGGVVPLSVALEIHADPHGRHDVRVDGDCRAPVPMRDVRLYDVDTEEGLRLLVDAIRKHGLVP